MFITSTTTAPSVMLEAIVPWNRSPPSSSSTPPGFRARRIDRYPASVATPPCSTSPPETSRAERGHTQPWMSLVPTRVGRLGRGEVRADQAAIRGGAAPPGRPARPVFAGGGAPAGGSGRGLQPGRPVLRPHQLEPAGADRGVHRAVGDQDAGGDPPHPAQ